MPPKTSKRPRKAPHDDAATGTYRYDKETGEIVRGGGGCPS